MNQIIIKQIVIKPQSVKMTFLQDQNDPFEKILDHHGPLPVNLQSHVDALANGLYENEMAVYEEKSKQTDMFDDSDDEIDCPFHPGTDIPDFDKLTKEGAIKYIDARYTGEDLEPGLADLIQDVKYNTEKTIPPQMSLEQAKIEAIEILYGS